MTAERKVYDAVLKQFRGLRCVVESESAPMPRMHEKRTGFNGLTQSITGSRNSMVIKKHFGQ